MWVSREIRLRTTTLAALRERCQHLQLPLGELGETAWQTLMAQSAEDVYDALVEEGFLTPDLLVLLPAMKAGLLKHTGGKVLQTLNRNLNTGAALERVMFWVYLPTFEALTAFARDLFVAKAGLYEVAVVNLLGLEDEMIQSLHGMYIPTTKKGE